MQRFKPIRGEGFIHTVDEISRRLATESWCAEDIWFSVGTLQCSFAELRWVGLEHLLLLTTGGSTRSTIIRVGGQVEYKGRDQPGAFTFIPANADRHNTYEAMDLAYVSLWVSTRIVSRLGLSERFLSTPLLNARQQLIAPLLRHLRDEVIAGRKPPDTYVSHLAAMAMLGIAERPGRSAGASTSSKTPRKLSARSFETVQAFIEANLGASLPVWQLSELLDMSADNFARQFKARVGMAPHTYVLSRRIERACEMLRTSDVSIGDVGLALGFYSPSHFTSVFRHLKGVSPSQFRRSAQ